MRLPVRMMHVKAATNTGDPNHIRIYLLEFYIVFLHKNGLLLLSALFIMWFRLPSAMHVKPS